MTQYLRTPSEFVYFADYENKKKLLLILMPVS